MSPSRQRRLAEQRAHAESLGLTFDEWRAQRKADGERRAHDHVARLDRIDEDRRFRLAHPEAMYRRDTMGGVRYALDAYTESLAEALVRQIMYGT